MATPVTTSNGEAAIALLNDHLHGGGTERVLSYLSGTLFPEGRGLVLVFDDAQRSFEYGGRILSLNVTAPPYANALQEAANLLVAWRRLRRAKRRYGIRVCISQKEGPNFINVLSGESRIVVTVHENKSFGIRYKGYRRRLVALLIRILYGRADRVVAVSAGIARDLAANFGVDPAKLRVIYNPCDFTAIAERSRDAVAPEHEALFDGPTLVTAGRLSTQKGQWHLIRAFARVRQRLSRARLLIIGTGDHLSYLQELAGSLGMADAVDFLGYQENPFSYMRRADVFVLTSLWEGLGAVIQEAMACGVPVVACDCPSGPRELLAPELDPEGSCEQTKFASCGVLTPRMDGLYKSAADPLTHGETSVADAAVRLLEETAMREHYRQKGRERAAQFGMGEYQRQWRELLDAL